MKVETESVFDVARQRAVDTRRTWRRVRRRRSVVARAVALLAVLVLWALLLSFFLAPWVNRG